MFIFSMLCLPLAALDTLDAPAIRPDVRQAGRFFSIGLGMANGEGEAELKRTTVKESVKASSLTLTGQLGYTYPVATTAFIRPSLFLTLVNMKNMDGMRADIDHHLGLQVDIGHKINQVVSIHGILLVSAISHRIALVDLGNSTTIALEETQLSDWSLGYGLGLERQLRDGYSVVAEYITQTGTATTTAIASDITITLSELRLKLSRRF